MKSRTNSYINFYMYICSPILHKYMIFAPKDKKNYTKHELNVELDTFGNKSPQVYSNIHLPFLVKFVQLWYIISKLTEKEDKKINFNIMSTTKAKACSHSSHQTCIMVLML